MTRQAVGGEEGEHGTLGRPIYDVYNLSLGKDTHTPLLAPTFLYIPQRGVFPDMVHGVHKVDHLRNQWVHFPLHTYHLQMKELGP